MSFDWSEYLILAQELASTSITSALEEAKLRSAISRAYYAAFCKARNYLIYEDREVIPRNANVHQYVIDKFETSAQKDRQTIGFLLRHMRSIRNIIDYQDRFHRNLKKTATGVLTEAAEVLRLLSVL